VANWTASAQTYVNNLHTFCPREYSYAYDENAGGALQTCATGSSYTITFCPAGSGTPATNLALNKPATASSTESTAFPATLAFDANGGTRWSSAFSDPQWIRVDLGASHAVNRVVLRWETAFARAYQIQISGDGNTWTTIHSTTAGAGGVEDFPVTGTGRFVRMNGTARGTQWGYSLWEFEVYGTP
jgi:hexosaminidase